MQHVKLKKVLAKLKPQSKKTLSNLLKYFEEINEVKKVEAAAYYFPLFSVGGSGA